MEYQKHKEFVGFLETCRKPLMNYLRYILWDKESLADAFQNTVLEGWKKFHSFKGDERGFRIWIFYIGNYVVRNLNRANKKVEALKDNEIASKIQDEGTELQDSQSFSSSVDQLSVARLLDGQVLDKMEDKVKESVVSLPESERNVFLLRSLGEFSYEEIGSILGIPIGSVMGYLARARVKLKEKLYEYARELKYI